MNKYHVAKKSERTFDGRVFSSKMEGNRYAFLKIMQQTGKITGLKCQPRFCLQESFDYAGKNVNSITYVADFEYTNSEGKACIEDVKGFLTEVYKIKRKLFLKKYSFYLFFEVKKSNDIGGIV